MVITIKEPGEKLEPGEVDWLVNFGVDYLTLCESAGLDPNAEHDTLNELVRRATPTPAGDHQRGDAPSPLYPSTVIQCIGCQTRVQLFSDGPTVSLKPLKGWVADELGQWLCPVHQGPADA